MAIDFIIRGTNPAWLPSDQKTHEAASAACAALGSTLVHIDDAAENAWIAGDSCTNVDSSVENEGPFLENRCFCDSNATAARQ